VINAVVRGRHEANVCEPMTAAGMLGSIALALAPLLFGGLSLTNQPTKQSINV
jgi:hypothetical protein